MTPFPNELSIAVYSSNSALVRRQKLHLATLLAANCDHVGQSFGGGLVPTLESIVLLLRCTHVGVYHSVPVEKSRPSSSGVVVPTWESGTNSNLCRKLWENSQRSSRERTPPLALLNYKFYTLWQLFPDLKAAIGDYFCCWKCEGVTAFSVWQTDSGIEYGHNMHRLSSQYAQNMLIMWKWMMIEYASIVTYDDIILSRICSYCDRMCSYHYLIDNLKISLDSYLHTYIL